MIEFYIISQFLNIIKIVENSYLKNITFLRIAKLES